MAVKRVNLQLQNLLPSKVWIDQSPTEICKLFQEAISHLK